MDNVVENLTLGSTTIGDLLLKSKITRTTNGNSIERINLTIPIYQRPYKWTAKNVNRLLDDIEDAMHASKEVYRVGTLILHKKNNNNVKGEEVKSNTPDSGGDDDYNIYNIVDGQQRTITFALLLKWLEEYLNEGVNASSQIAFLNQRLTNNTYNLQNIVNNYRAIERRLQNHQNKKELNDFCKYIKDNCELIVVITDDLSEAFQFFDSQNARGKALYPHDLLKAFHLREMLDCDEAETVHTVKMWEDLDQKVLSDLFKEYLYRLKEWIKGNRPDELSEGNIEIFKGITSKDTRPYAQFFKGAYSYADKLNHSHVPFVTGQQKLRPFQLNVPIIAGKPFFEFAKYYFDILADIRNNSKYEGFFINDNEIVKTLDYGFKNGIGNRITRLLFDTALLLYVDRFCPSIPSKSDLVYLDQFVVYAFVWAYSMRAQYTNVGWLIAKNYVEAKKDGIINSFNIYKDISDSDSPGILLSKLAEKLKPLPKEKIANEKIQKKLSEKLKQLSEENKDEDLDGKVEIVDENGNKQTIIEHYLYYFIYYKFLF